MNNNNQVSALQATVMVAVALLMVGRAVYEIYEMIGKLALRLGKDLGKKYYGSEYYSPVVSEIMEAVSEELQEIENAGGKYLCGWLLFISTVHEGWVYLRNFDYVQSVELENTVRKYAVDMWEWYVTEWKKVFA